MTLVNVALVIFTCVSGLLDFKAFHCKDASSCSVLGYWYLGMIQLLVSCLDTIITRVACNVPSSLVIVYLRVHVHVAVWPVYPGY